MYIYIYLYRNVAYLKQFFFSVISYNYIYFLQSYWKLAVHKTVNCKFNCFFAGATPQGYVLLYFCPELISFDTRV